LISITPCQLFILLYVAPVVSACSSPLVPCPSKRSLVSVHRCLPTTDSAPDISYTV